MYAYIDSELLSLIDCEFESLKPFGRIENQRPGLGLAPHNIAAIRANVKYDGRPVSVFRHRLQVGLNALLGNVAVNPMPPSLGARLSRRI